MSDSSPTVSRTHGSTALIGLGVLIGIQELRAFLALVTFRLYDTEGLAPGATALVALAVMASGLGGVVAARRGGWAQAVRAVTALLAAVRVAEQLVLDPAVDLRLAAAGSALFAILLSLVLTGARRAAAARAATAFAVLLALAADTAVRTLGGTLDLSWRQDATAMTLALVPPAIALALALLRPAESAAATPAPAAHTGSWLALGAWLALHLLVFSNAASLAARAGMPLARAGAFVVGGTVLALLAAALVQRWDNSPWRTVEAAGLTVAGVLVALRTEPDAWFGYLVGPPGMAVLLFGMLASAPARARRGLLAGLWGVVFLVPTYLWYGRFEQPVGPGEELLAPGLAAVLVAAGLWSAWRSRREPLPVPGRWLAAGMLLAAAAGLAAAQWPGTPPAAATAPAADVVRVMTYNVHQGFNTAGRLDPESLARVIESESPDIVALQEVSRGWLVTGGLDLFDWLARRLGMNGVFAGTADAQWGNAILSRYRLSYADRHALPPAELPLRRGLLEVRVDTASGETIRVLSTHFHHRRSERAVRLVQAEALLEIWAGSPATLVLGDLNSDPASEPIRRLRAAGFHDASELLPLDRRATMVKPTHSRQIDWIFATPDLELAAPSVLRTNASDHLPLAATARLVGNAAQPPPERASAAGARR